MVAIFTGRGSGFAGSSATVIGSAGLLGSASFGRAAEQLFVNAATGNVMVTQHDEFLAGRGPDLALDRTYNSLGDRSDNNGDNWRLSAERTIELLNGPTIDTNSWVRRVAGDGSGVTYLWDAQSAAYVARTPEGAIDSLVFNNSEWIWTDGTTQTTERYAAPSGGRWRIVEESDTDGNKLSFNYSGKHLTRITSADGGWIQYGWTGNNVTELITGSDAAGAPAAQTRVRYRYDDANRLTSVIVDLSPEDGTIDDGRAYVSTYGYSGDSRLVASITQTDGSRADFVYDQQGRVTNITQWAGANDSRLTTFSYGGDYTLVTDPAGQVTRLEYDTSGDLLKIAAPPPRSGDPDAVTSFFYTGANWWGMQFGGVRDSLGNTIYGYSYDDRGNRTGITNYPSYMATTRTFGAHNELLTERRTGSSSSGSSQALVTRYAYDAELHMRYRIDAEGGVTEYRYNAQGQSTDTIDYPEHRFDLGGFPQDASPSEAQLDAWRDALADRSTIRIVSNLYDVRGTLTATIRYASVSTGGVPSASAGDIRDTYAYDMHGRLVAHARTGEPGETYAYDGLGRTVASTRSDGDNLSIAFLDSQLQTVITHASGQVRTTVYDALGSLLATSDMDTAGDTRTTYDRYDRLGQRRIAIDAGGNKQYQLFDARGRKVADVSALGEMTEYRYDIRDRLVATVRYGGRVAADALASLGDPSTAVDPAQVRPAASTDDLWSWQVQSDAGAIQTIDGSGYLTDYYYDAAGQLIETRRYATALDAATLAGFKTSPPTARVSVAANAAYSQVQTFYDRTGRLIGTIDGEGGLIAYRYDAGGLKIEEIAYAALVPAGARGGASFDSIRASLPAGAGDRHTRYAYDDMGQLRYVINAGDQVVGYQYDGAGRRTLTVEYGAIAYMPSGFAAIESALQQLGAASWSGIRKHWSIYDATGRLAYAIDPENALTGYRYDAFGRVVRTTAFAIRYPTSSQPGIDAAGNWAASQDGNPDNRVTRTYYSARGDVLYTVDGEGYVTGNAYDGRGLTVQTKRWAYRVTVDDTTSLAGLQAQLGADWTDTRMAYDADGRPSDSWDGEGIRRHWEYNPDGTVLTDTIAYGTADEVRTRFDYDAAGRMIARFDADGTTDQAVMQYAYDAAGNVVSITDPNGRVTQRTFDKDNRLTSSIDALGGTTQYQYDTFGDVIRTVDPLGNAVQKIYDLLGRVTTVRDAEDFVTENSYSMFGDLTQVIRRAAKGGAPSAQDAVTQMGYDRLGRLSTITDAEGALQSHGRNTFGDEISFFNGIGWTDFTGYDRRGLVAWKTKMAPSQDSTGAQVAASVVTRFTYDARGNRIQMIEGEYLPEQRTTKYFYDKAGRLKETWGDPVTVVDQADHMTTTTTTPRRQFLYDTRGNVIETIEPNGARTTSYYDKRNRKIAEIGPEGGYSMWSYDANGNMLKSRVFENQFLAVYTSPGGPPAPRPTTPPAAPDGLVRRTVYTYDALNRLVTTRVAAQRIGSWNGSGYVTGVADIVTTNAYDGAGRLIRVTDGAGKSTATYYDKNGRKTAEVDPDLYLTTWSVDTEGNVLVERRYATKLATAPGATPPVGSTSADDRETAFTYDRVGRRLSETRRNVVAWVVAANGTLSAAATDSTVRYVYDALGKVVRRTEASGDTVDYTYDMTGRLIQETRAGYMSNDNAAVSPTVRYYYNAHGDLTLTRQGNVAMAAGDRLTRYAYETGGRLRSVTDAAYGGTTYTYDCVGNVVTQTYVRQKSDGSQVGEGILYTRDLFGRVISQTTRTWTGSAWAGDGDTQDTVYDAFGQVIASGVNGGAQVQSSYDPAGRLWRSNQGDGIWRYFVYDAQGNRTLTIESEGADLANKTIDQVLAIATENGAHDIGAAMVDGIDVTINAYSGRGQLTYTLMPRRELDMAGTLGDQQDKRIYNAFGELAYENINGRDVSYTYNTMGRSTAIQQSLVQVTREDGITASVRPTESYFYDLSGRLVGVQDANGRQNTRLLLAGSGYGGQDPLVVAEFHPDGGVVRYGYDAFADVRSTTDEIGRVATASYDGMGRVTSSTRGDKTDYYTYDVLGRRLKHWTSVCGTAVYASTDYDTQGRVVRSVATGGDVTTTSYTWNAGLATPGMATVGGWTTLTTYANGRTLTEQADLFGHDVYRKDLGGHEYRFSYDLAGRMVESTAIGGDALSYTYLNTGWVGRIVTIAKGGAALQADRSTTYGYDLMGNLTVEQYSENSRYPTGSNPRRDYRNATATYDLLGRLTKVVDAGGAVPASTMEYWYDAIGNVREVKAQYRALDAQGNAASTVTTSDNWYRYDAMNRVATSQGILSGGQIVKGATGIDLQYDAAGQRVRAIRQVGGTDQTERYTYDQLGDLLTVRITIGAAAERLASVYQYDALGRVKKQTDYSGNGTGAVYDRAVTYNNKDQIATETVSGVQGSDSYQTVNTYYYDTGTTASYALGAVVAIATTNTRNGATQPASRTENDFAWYGGAVQSVTRYKADVNAATTFTSTYANNAWGQLTSVTIADGRPRTVKFVTDTAGQVIRRDESDANTSQGDPHELWYRFGGEQHGYLGNNGTFETSYQESIANRMATVGTGPFRLGSTTSVARANFEQNYAPVTSYTQGGSGGVYAVQSGDTLQSIAAQLWGDSALWYKLAEANGMSASGALIEGQQLIVPRGVQRSSNTAATFNPYDPLEALGDTSPTTPAPQAKPKKKKCGGVLGTIIMVVIAVAVTIVTRGAALKLVPTILGSTTAAATAAGAVGAAAGSIASQGFGLATGLQDKFSWKGVGLAAIGGGVSGGLEAKFGVLSKNAGFAETLRRGAAQSVLAQGVGIVTGLQPKFDWAGLAAASVGSALMGAARGAIIDALSVPAADSWLRQVPDSVKAVGMSMAEGIGQAAASSLLNGTSFGDNLLTTLPEAIGNTIGGIIGEDLKTRLLSTAAGSSAARLSNDNAKLSKDQVIEAIIDGMDYPITGKTYRIASADFIISKDDDIFTFEDLPKYIKDSKDFSRYQMLINPETKYPIINEEGGIYLVPEDVTAEYINSALEYASSSTLASANGRILSMYRDGSSSAFLDLKDWGNRSGPGDVLPYQKISYFSKSANRIITESPFEDTGNLLYAFAGRSAGLSQGWLRAMAGLFQEGDKVDYSIDKAGQIPKIRINRVGDAFEDRGDVNLGFKLFDTYKRTNRPVIGLAKLPKR